MGGRRQPRTGSTDPVGANLPQILPGIGVPLRAMGPVGKVLASGPLPGCRHILRVGDGAKVRRVHAASNPTNVVNFAAFRDWPHKHHVCDTVGGLLLSVEPEVSVASRDAFPGPTPMAVLGGLELDREAFGRRS